MLECRACLVRCLRAVAGDARPALGPNFETRRGIRLATKSTDNRALRNYRENAPLDTNPASVQDDDMLVFHELENEEKEMRHDRRKKRHTGEEAEKDTDAGPPKKTYTDEQTWINKNRGRRIDPAHHSKSGVQEIKLPNVAAELEKSIKKELQWIKDPMKLAERVRYVLQTGNLEKALGICRLASRDMECVVSWNHVIGHLLSRKQFNVALKIYNEMKKRAQFPDAHTYAIILRGLSEPPVHKEMVSKALAIYHSMSAPNSRVKATTIHTNCALRVCARAYDMDSLWGIASRIPEKGPGAADAYTYATILNAIREHALLESGDRKDDAEVASLRATAVQSGRRIWGDIVGKWRNGDIQVNEEMVGAMGRLLLIGLRPKDWDDVLSLIEQTMEVPRLTPRLGTVMRRGEHIPKHALSVMGEAIIPRPKDEQPQNEFDRDLIMGKQSASVLFVKPGNNSLSMILDACQKMFAFKTANEYWDILTDQTTYGLKPDTDNLHMYLRILRQSRASARTVELLESIGPAYRLKPVRKTWRIAMSTCSRDKNNPNVMDHAHKLMDMMRETKVEADPNTLLQYLELAISTERGDAISEAIKRLSESVTELKSLISFGKTESDKSSATDKSDVLLLMRTIVGAIDQMLNKDMIPREERTAWSQRRARLGAWITRLTDRMETKSGIPREKLRDLRKESRQLRHFRAKNVKREKQANGTWVDRKEGRKESRKPLSDLPFADL